MEKEIYYIYDNFSDTIKFFEKHVEIINEPFGNCEILSLELEVTEIVGNNKDNVIIIDDPEMINRIKKCRPKSTFFLFSQNCNAIT